ncbi:MAG TPA: NlpC/P60 family protein [Nocardioidaceae bacterium]|nr:NlpC/P60 family protein [Nocardioidaceae bacterium]
MTAAAILRRGLWALPALALVLVCGGAGPAHGDAGWTWPLQPTPRVVRPFDPPSEAWSAGHRGVDLLGSPGQPVLAPGTGRVVFAADLAGRGVVVVETDGLRATFEPVTPALAVGDRVVAGQVLGHLQPTRSHCLPAACLHWGVKHGEDLYVDPLSLVGGGDIVLLPFLAPPTPTRSVAAWSAPTGVAYPPATGTRTHAAATAVRFALDQLGDPYVWAAAGPDAWDCSGLTMAAWAAAGRPLPHYSAAQYASTTPISPAELRAGDLVFWSDGGPTAIYHVALYLGAGQVVHAPRPGTQVRVEGMRSWEQPAYFGRV